MIRRNALIWTCKRRSLYSSIIQRKSWKFRIQFQKALHTEWARRHERIWTPFKHALRSKRLVFRKIRNYWRFATVKKRGWRKVKDLCWERTWKVHWKAQVRKIWKKMIEVRKIKEDYWRNETEGRRREEETRRRWKG